MAKLVPFRGLRYNLSIINDPAEVMAPPYDAISPDLQEELYQRHPKNVVRLILGKTSPQDDENDNRYTRAASDFARWQDESILLRDAEPSIYLYDQEFTSESGEPVLRRGIIGLARLEEFSSGVVKPHEMTLAGPRTDRFNLTKTCGAHFSPIFSLYSDPCCVMETLTRKPKERMPDLEVIDDEGIRHRLWQVTDRGIIDKAKGLLDNKPLFIADGHHRYETSLAYRNFMREKHPGYTGKELFNYVLMYFANMEDKGMQIFPTHRLVFNLAGFHLGPFLSALEDYFNIETRELDLLDPGGRLQVRKTLQEKGKANRCLAMLAGRGKLYYLTLRDASAMNAFFDEKSPKVLRTLDVSVLHRLIFEKLLHISPEEQEQQTHIKYVRDFDEPFERVERGEFQLAFLMNPTRMNEVRDVANAGEKMPYKSTFFYPKLLSGLVINRIAEGETVTD